MEDRQRLQSLTHYGLCSLAYSSYILDGMYRVADSSDLSVTVKRSVPHDYRQAAAGHENMQMMLLFDAVDHDGRRIRFCVDNHDKAHFIHQGVLSIVDLYFKLNHNPQELNRLRLPQSEQDKIHAVKSPISPLRLNRWSHRPALHKVDEVGWGPRNMARRVRHLARFSTMEEIVSLRSTPPSVDVVFIVRIYRETHHQPVNEIRYEIARRLESHPDINATVGFLGRTDGKFARFATPALATKHHLAQLASSRVGVYVWGPHRCLSFKMAELLALGLPVVGMPIQNDHANLGSRKILAEQFAYPDPASLVDAVAKALDDDSRLTELRRANTELFDTELAPEPTARRLLAQVFGM